MGSLDINDITDCDGDITDEASSVGNHVGTDDFNFG